MGSQRMVGLKIQKLSKFIQHENLDEAYQYLLSYWGDSECLKNYRSNASGMDERFGMPKTEEFIERVLFWDQMSYLPGDNLTKVDRASMAVSLETRLPLLSHQVVELSWRIPLVMKVRCGESKWLLKQVLYKYVPKELVDRPKMGFSVPVASWLRNELYDWASELLASDMLKENDLLNGEVIRKTWEQHIKGDMDHALKLWGVLMFLSWSER